MLSFLTSPHRAQLHCAFSGRSKGPHRAPPRAVTSTADRPRNLDRFAAPTSAAANVAPTVRAKRSGKAMICQNCAWDLNHSFFFGCTHDGSWLKLLSNCKKMKIRENMPYVPFYHSTHGRECFWRLPQSEPAIDGRLVNFSSQLYPCHVSLRFSVFHKKKCLKMGYNYNITIITMYNSLS